MNDNSTEGWYCVSNNNPIVWAFGELRLDKVVNIKASVERLANGRWSWRAMSFMSLLPMGAGTEPTREIAQQAAQEFLEMK